MIYISKGIVQEKSTERNIYVGRGGQVFQLTKIEAQLWLDGRFGFYTTKNASQERAIEHLYRMGLVEFEQEDTFVARYRILTRVSLLLLIICPLRSMQDIRSLPKQRDAKTDTR